MFRHELYFSASTFTTAQSQTLSPAMPVFGAVRFRARRDWDRGVSLIKHCVEICVTQIHWNIMAWLMQESRSEYMRVAPEDGCGYSGVRPSRVGPLSLASRDHRPSPKLVAAAFPC